ncbi:MAG: hypothetical protein ACKV2Q_12385 [Planctomycetaceae bacterium]
MGITIHYRGQFADLDRVEDFEDRVLDLVLDLRGKAEVWRSTASDDPSRMVRGLLVNLEPGQETLSLLISPEGWLITPFQIEEAEQRELTEPPWCFCKTQFGSLTGHVAVAELLAAIRKEFVPNLEVSDEGGYWETRDVAEVARKKSFLDRAITEFTSALEQHGLTNEAAEDTNILLTRIERIAAKVQRTIGRPSEHPPIGLSDEGFSAERDVAATEAQYDELFKHTERRKEQLHRALEQRLQNGEDHSTAFENALRDIGLSVPGDPDWPIDDDTEDSTNRLNDPAFDSEANEAWSEADAWKQAALDDVPESDKVFDDEMEREERHDHPLLRRATELWHSLTDQFKDADARHEPQLRTLFRGVGDLVGGLAQATSGAFDRDDDDAFSPLDEMQFGLTVTQLKRSLRGIAFARGALCNLREIIPPTESERYQHTLTNLNDDILEELHRERERFQDGE